MLKRNEMTEHERHLRMVSNQMLKGPTHSRYPRNIPLEQREQFFVAHRDLIEEVYDNLPQYMSTAVAAVICKCALKYGREKALRFADKLSNTVFEGTGDPAFYLFNYLRKARGKTPVEIYRHTVYTARAYCEGQKLKRIRAAESDVEIDLGLPK